MLVFESMSERIKACGVGTDLSDVNIVYIDEHGNNVDPQIVRLDQESDDYWYEANGKRIAVERCIVDETSIGGGSDLFPYHTPGWSLSGLLYLLNEYDGREFSLFCRNNRWYVRYGDMETTEGSNHPEGACILFLEQFKDKLSRTNCWISNGVTR